MRQAGFSVTVVAPPFAADPEYPAPPYLELRAWNSRFSATTRAFSQDAGLEDLAKHIAGFPKSELDDRQYSFGHLQGELFAGKVPFSRGYCRLRFHYDLTAHALLDVYFEDDSSQATASFVVPFEASDLDRFVAALNGIASRSPADVVGTSALLGPSD